MPLPSIEPTRRLRSVGYVVAAVLFLVPLVEVCTSAWPLQIGQAPWRLAFVGSLTSSLLVPILALFLTLTLAVIAGDRPASWTVSGVCLTGFVLLIVATGMFALDALQMKAQVPSAMTRRYMIASVWVLMKLLAEAVTLLSLSITAFRVAAGMRRERIVAGEKAPLIVRSVAAPAAERNVPV
jgi:hypothetical protein